VNSNNSIQCEQDAKHDSSETSNSNNRMDDTDDNFNHDDAQGMQDADLDINITQIQNTQLNTQIQPKIEQNSQNEIQIQKDKEIENYNIIKNSNEQTKNNTELNSN